MSYWKRYLLPQTLTEALQAFSADPAAARFIAGGTDLLLDLQQGRQPPVDTLIDLNSIPELQTLEVRRDGLFIGAAVPLSRLVSSALLKTHAQALVEACDLIGGPQVRNTGTLGGNVAHALPAADGTIALLALNALAHIATMEEVPSTLGKKYIPGIKYIPLEELFVGPGKSALSGKPEIIIGFEMALLQPGEGSAFCRVMRPQGVALPILNTAVWVKRERLRIQDVRIAVGPAGMRPFRARQTERSLISATLDAESLSAAGQTLLGEAAFRTSPHRATADYRKLLSGHLLEVALSAALERAGEGSAAVL